MSGVHCFQTFLLYACLGALGILSLVSLIMFAGRPMARVAVRMMKSGWVNALLALAAVAVMVVYGGEKPGPAVPTPEDAFFRVTPYVQHPSTNAMSILWVSDSNAWAMLEVWPASDRSNYRFYDVRPREATELGYFGYSHPKQYLPSVTQWQYRCRITDLQPDTEYGYRVYYGNGESYTNSFRTAPMEFRPVHFVAYSDSETQPSSTGDRVVWENYAVDNDTTPNSGRRYYIDQTEGYASNICTIVASKPDFIVIAGDLAEKGSDQTHWDEFWRHNAGELNDPAGSTPILAAPGNHEYHGYYAADDYGERGMKKFLSYFEFEPNGAAVEEDRQERFHRVDYGPVAMIFIDTNNGRDYYSDSTSDMVNSENGTPNMQDTTQPLFQDRCRAPDFNPGSEQYRWLEEQLADAQTNKLFTFLVCHQCPFSVGYHGRLNGEYGTESSKEYLSGAATRCLTNLVFKYGVDAWLCGHDELYEHSRLTGTETLPNGMTRRHELNVYDVGMGGDGLRGCNRTGRPNPYEVYRAHVDAPEVYDATGTLISGGKHYGHMDVNVTTNADGVWTATLTPTYVFVSSNTVTGKISFERRTYPDEVVITNVASQIFDFTMALGANVNNTAFTINGTEYTGDGTFPVHIGDQIELGKITYDEGYMAGPSAPTYTGLTLGNGIYTVTGDCMITLADGVAIVAKVGSTEYSSLADALAGAHVGDTVKLFRNAEGAASLTTAAATLDLNGKMLTGPTSITFTGAEAKTLKGGEMTGTSLSELSIKCPENEDLTIDGMMFHTSVRPSGSGNLLFITNCTFKCDLTTAGAANTGNGETVHSYGVILNNASWAQADIVCNWFAQGRRAAVEVCYAGDLYFYGNTVDATLRTVASDDGLDALYPALQIFSNGRVFIENNTFFGQYLGEPFIMYNKNGYRTTDKAVVFNGNIVGNGVHHLWGLYDGEKTGTAAIVEPNVFFGANVIDANVDLTKCVYKKFEDGVPSAPVPVTLALPAGVDSVYAWTHASNATDYCVNDTPVADMDALAAGDVIVTVPGVVAETAPVGCHLEVDDTLKNKWEVALNRYTVSVDGVETVYFYGDIVTFAAPETLEVDGMQVVTLGTTYTMPVVTNVFTVMITNDVAFSWDVFATNWWFEVDETQNGTIEVTGRVAPNVPQTGCWVADGEKLTLLAVPYERYCFAGWTGDWWRTGDSTPYQNEDENPLDVIMDRPRTIGAEFEIPITLAQAVNAEDLDWTTGGAVRWQPMWAEDANDGLNQARCKTIPNGTNAWIATTVDGPGVLVFSWRSALASYNTKYQVMVDGEVKGMLIGTNDWRTVSMTLLGNSNHEIKWRLMSGRSGAASGDWVALDEVSWTPAVPPTLAEALNTNLTWTTEGDVQWHGVSRESLIDERVAWAAVDGLGDSETSAVQTRVYGSGVLVFDWAISCEEDYDWMALVVDGEMLDYITGEKDWTTAAIAIEGGGWHTVEWRYFKDELDDPDLAGENVAKLDNVVWRSEDVPPMATNTPVPVPYSEMETRYATYLEQANGDYDEAARMTGRNGYAIWESYLAGLEPDEEDSVFKTTIKIVDGNPVVGWSPYKPELLQTRIYKTLGKRDIGDPDEKWTEVKNGEESLYRFFKVTVELP